LKYKAEVGEEGTITLPRLYLDKGTSVEIIVLVRESDAENDALLAASQSSTDFWDNTIDDAVWNNA